MSYYDPVTYRILSESHDDRGPLKHDLRTESRQKRMAVVLPSSREPKSRDWDNNELSNFTALNILVQASIALETDRGLTDEGDPGLCSAAQVATFSST